MEIDNGIFVLSAMLLHRRFSTAEISKLTSLSRSTVWRWVTAIPSVYPGTVIKTFDINEYQLEKISPLFNEDGLHEYFELCLAQLESEKDSKDAVSPLAEMNIMRTEQEGLSVESNIGSQPTIEKTIEPPPHRFNKPSRRF